MSPQQLDEVFYSDSATEVEWNNDEVTRRQNFKDVISSGIVDDSAKDNLEEFRIRINNNSKLTKEDFIEKVKIDVPMPMYYPTMELVREFELLAPFGNGNPKPLFMDKELKIKSMWIIGKNQNVLKLSLVTSIGTIVDGIYFGNIADFIDYVTDKFGQQEVDNAMNGRINNIKMAMVYAVKINIFREMENLQFEIKYYK